MFSRSLTAILLIVLSLNSAVFAQSGIASYASRASFTSDAENLTTIDFEGIVPNSGFRNFKSEGSLVTAGIEFRPGGGARFGAGHITVVGPWYLAGPIYETTSGAKLIWAPPNQPGNAYLDIIPPGGTTAVGVDLWAAQPYVSPVDVEVVTANGRKTLTIDTPNRPAAGFVGFVSDSAITSLRITPARGQTGLVLDNFTFGRGSKNASRPASDETRPAAGSPGRRKAGDERPQATRTATEETASASRQGSTSSAGSSTVGKIAYTRNDTEIRLIAPDGTNDRRLWTHPHLTNNIGLYELDWRPDGKELAFSSSHSNVTSFYHADIYTIQADGSGLRKLTNAPDHSELARFPKGSVTVTVRNFQPASTTPGTFIIYVAGADEPQQIVLPAGSSKTVVFKSVADFGKHVQPVVAMFGPNRWHFPGVDVQAGRNVAAPLTISGDGIELLGAFRPTWRGDGSRISYRSGHCVVSHIPANPVPGQYSFDPLFSGKHPSGACTWDYGPTPETANQIIYTDNGSGSSIFRITEGGTLPGTKLTEFSDLDHQLLYDLQWLPDGSGILYSTVNLFRDSGNIFRWDFATKRVRQITRLKNEFAKSFSISPDSRSVVFERCRAHEDDKNCDLWITDANSGEMRLLVRNGLRPSWGR